MKKFLLMLAILVYGITFNIPSLIAQTTQEEYNYLTKGYKVQIESGLDMKKGYSLKDITEHSISNGGVIRKCIFKALLKDGQTKPCAILCIYSRSDNNFVDYLCIPAQNSSKEIWDQAFEKFKSYSETGATALIWGLANLSSYYTNK